MYLLTHLVWFSVFLSRVIFVAQANFVIMIFLPQSLQCWGYRWVPPYLADLP